MAMLQPGAVPGGGVQIAQQLVTLVRRQVAAWLGTAVQWDKGIVTRAEDGGVGQGTATVDLGLAQTDAVYVLVRFTADDLKGRVVRVAWDSRLGYFVDDILL